MTFVDDDYIDEVLKNISAYGVGITNMPIDIMKYSALFANEGQELLGLRDKQTADEVESLINTWAERPPIYPDSVNDYREWVKSQSPQMESLGQVAGGALAGGFHEGLPYLLQKGSKLARMIKSNPAILVTLKEIMEEYGLEPQLDNVLSSVNELEE